MIEAVYISIVLLLWGGALGLLYFGGLWFTIHRFNRVKHPAVWMLSSLLIRTLLVMIGFYPVVHLGWQQTMLCLIGLIVVRIILIKRIKPSHHLSP